MSDTRNNWFNRLRSRANKLFSGKGYSFSKENDHFYQKTMQRFGEWNKKLRHKHEILNEIADDGKDIQVIGIIDGYRGQNPATMKRIVNHVASLWQSFIASTFKEELSSAKKKKKELRVRYRGLKKERKRLFEYQKIINSDYNLNSKDYSVVLGLAYLTVSIILIMADLPLSIDVVKNGFNINDGLEKEQGLLGTNSKTLAWGIVLITIYFKVFYDEYVGSSTSKSILRMKPDMILGSGITADDADMGQIKKIKRRKFITKLLILTMLVATLFSMGKFRAQYMEVDREETIATQVGVTGSSQGTAPTSTTTNPIPLKKKTNTYEELMLSTNTKSLFILLSIMFPLIGGICASIGVNTLHNVWDRIKIRRRLNTLARKKARVLKHLSVAKSAVDSCENNLEWVNKDGDFVHERSAYNFTYYLHGFEWGLGGKMPDDFYEVAKHMRTQHSKIQSTQVFYDEIAKSSTDSVHLHSLFFPKQIKQVT